MVLSAVSQLRAVLDDLVRIGLSDEWLAIEVVGFGNSEARRRACLRARGLFAVAVQKHPELEVDIDLGPASITALAAVDPEAATVFVESGSRREFATAGKQVVFVFGEKRVRLYENGSYAYTMKAGSSLLVDYWTRGRRWEPKDWCRWPLEDVVDIAPRVLEEQPELALVWRETAAGTTETVAADRLELGARRRRREMRRRERSAGPRHLDGAG